MFVSSNTLIKWHLIKVVVDIARLFTGPAFEYLAGFPIEVKGRLKLACSYIVR